MTAPNIDCLLISDRDFFITKVVKLLQQSNSVETISQTDFHNILDYTCQWPSVFLLAKPYVPSSQNNSEIAAPQGVNIVKLSLDASKKEPQILQIEGSFKSLSNISISPEINHLSFIGLTEDNHIILYRINILSLKIVKHTENFKNNNNINITTIQNNNDDDV